VKSRYTITNLVSYLDYIAPLVFSQCPVDAIYFDLSSSIGHVPDTFLLLKLSACGLSNSYIGFVVGVTGRYYVRIHGMYSTRREVLSGIPPGTVLGAGVI
jgi:hypothetical protein